MAFCEAMAAAACSRSREQTEGAAYFAVHCMALMKEADGSADYGAQGAPIICPGDRVNALNSDTV